MTATAQHAPSHHKSRATQSEPTTILAYGFVVAICIVAGGVSTKWVVPALGAGFGIATTIISNGINASTTDLSWVIPAGAAGLIAVGGVAVVFLRWKATKGATGQPYLYVLPLLAVLAGFCVDMCKDFYPSLPLVRIGFGAVTSAIFVMGGLWYRRYGLLNKFAGTALLLISPLVILAQGVSGSIDQGLGAALGRVTTQSWMALGGLMILLALTGLLAFTLRDEINQ